MSIHAYVSVEVLTFQSLTIALDGMPLQRTESRTLYQHSKFISEDEEEASEAWGSILAGHGVVAIEPEYASSKGLPETIELPNSGGKLTYAIEAYHAIHCIVSRVEPCQAE
jgi:hypothetical protein